MKKIIFLFILLTPFFSTNAQETKKSRKEIRTEKEMKKKQEIKQLINDKSFVFSASQAMPMGGSSINLNSYFNAKIEGDSIYSYLPYYGVAYSAQYGQSKSPFNFDKPIKEYSSEKEKDGYLVKFEAKNENDHVNFTFHISELGYTSLSVTSTNRQPISFSGTIEAVEKEEGK